MLYLFCPCLLCAQSLMEVKSDTLYSEALSQVRSFRVAWPKDMPSDTKYLGQTIGPRSAVPASQTVKPR